MGLIHFYRTPGASSAAIATLLRGVEDPAAVTALTQASSVVFLDQFALLEEGYRGLRRFPKQLDAIDGGSRPSSSRRLSLFRSSPDSLCG